MTALVSQYANIVPSGTKQRGVRMQLGTTAENDAYTGAAGELTFDTDLETLRVHDGVTAGGGTTLGVQGGAYGSLTWEEELIEATYFQRARGGEAGPGNEPPLERIARGVTRAVVGGAGRTDSRNVTVGTDGTLTFSGNRTRPMMVAASVTLSQDHEEYHQTCGLHLYRNGSPVPGAVVYSDVQTTKSAEDVISRLGRENLSLSVVLEMKPDDTVQLRLSNRSTDATVWLRSGTFTIHSL